MPLSLPIVCSFRIAQPVCAYNWVLLEPLSHIKSVSNNSLSKLIHNQNLICSDLACFMLLRITNKVFQHIEGLIKQKYVYKLKNMQENMGMIVTFCGLVLLCPKLMNLSK